jgi:hypothetical protein
LTQYPEWQAYEAYLKEWLKDLETISYDKGESLEEIGARVVGMVEMKRELLKHLNSVSVLSKMADRKTDDLE